MCTYKTKLAPWTLQSVKNREEEGLQMCDGARMKKQHIYLLHYLMRKQQVVYVHMLNDSVTYWDYTESRLDIWTGNFLWLCSTLVDSRHTLCCLCRYSQFVHTFLIKVEKNNNPNTRCGIKFQVKLKSNKQKTETEVKQYFAESYKEVVF